MEIPSHHEYGISHKGDLWNQVHREGMTKEEARVWMEEWLEMGGKPDAYRIVRRPIGTWKTVKEGS